MTFYDEKTNAYKLPGGAIKVGEKTEDALQREVREELGIAVKIDYLAFVVENRFYVLDKQYHNIEWHYVCQPIPEDKTKYFMGDTGMQTEWLDIAKHW